jgi:hypothetical protein
MKYPLLVAWCLVRQLADGIWNLEFGIWNFFMVPGIFSQNPD